MSTLENLPSITTDPLAAAVAKFNAKFKQNLLLPCDPETMAQIIKLVRDHGDAELATEMAAAFDNNQAD